MTHVHYCYVQINVLKFKFTQYTISSEPKSIANTNKRERNAGTLHALLKA